MNKPIKSFIAAMTLAAIAVSETSAATLSVTSLADDGSDGTLRAVCASASDGDTIEFSSSLAGGTIAITTASGPIEIAKTVSIVGPEDGPITIDGLGGAGGTRSFTKSSRTTNLIYASNPDATLTLKNLVLTGSLCNQDSATPEVGPAVSVVGSAVIDNCCFTNNALAQTGSYGDNTGDGGACLRVVGNATVANSKFLESGVNGANYSWGGLASFRGAKVSIANCVFSGSYGWNASTAGGNVRGGAIIGLGQDVADFTISDALMERATAGASCGGIMLAPNCNGTYRFKNCSVRDIWGVAANWRSGGFFTYQGGNAIVTMFENCTFSNIRYNGWGGVYRCASGSARAVFANCTFVNVYGEQWGTVVDNRGSTYVVNCTVAGNVNGSGQTNASLFFTESRTICVLNSVCAWNYKNGGSTLHDCSKYGGTMAFYNSYNGGCDTAPNVTDNMMDYDETTKFFAEPFVQLSAFRIWEHDQSISTAISSPVLTIDEKAEKADPAARRVVEILPAAEGGVLDRTGWPVKHDAYWENIACSKDGGATWTALCGDASSATIYLEEDSRGAAYKVVNGVPLPPIGAASPKKNVGGLVFVVF